MLHYVSYILYGGAGLLMLLAAVLFALNYYALGIYSLEQRIARCKHPPSPVAVKGQPGKECQKCRYYLQITSREFKELFGMSFNKMSRVFTRSPL